MVLSKLSCDRTQEKAPCGCVGAHVFALNTTLKVCPRKNARSSESSPASARALCFVLPERSWAVIFMIQVPKGHSAASAKTTFVVISTAVKA